MSPVRLVSMPGADDLADALAVLSGFDVVRPAFRRFPDGESYLRIDADLADTAAVVVARLDSPDEKIPALLFASDLARDLGAGRVGLVCPYLPYMRQDKRFRPGEALTSATFARWLSQHFDWLATVDPHLHRYASLDEIYTLESEVVASAPAIARWILAHVDAPVVIGPDAESEQWVRAVAEPHGLDWRVMTKRRFGDRAVEVSGDGLDELEGRTPVLIDDIASSGATLAEAATVLKDAGLDRVVCVVVHGLFGEGARQRLAAAGIKRIACTDSVTVPEARIELAPLLAPAVARLAMNVERESSASNESEP